MQNEILINATAGETRVAIVERNEFVELHLERSNQRSVAGSVVKGRVTRVLPGMQAAFVDIGLEKAAFLYAGDYVEDIERLDDDGDEESRGRRSRRNRNVANIGSLLEEGQEIVVQIAKEPIGTKGARITSHVSIAGRHLVLTPWAQRVGVSRKIDSDKERRRLREIVNRVKTSDLGFIIRTAGEGTREADLEADVRYLTTVWDDIQIRKDKVRAPAVLYAEPALPLRVIRDFANLETKRIIVDSESAHGEMKAFVDRFVADPRPGLELYRGANPIFDEFGIESQIDANLGRKARLKSGGYLIIDQSEALTAIDVNTGRYVGKRDLEETVLKTNLEAVREVVHQLRFRNIGGLIIIDLIDMDSAENREKVYRALQEAIRGDKAKTNILKISELGLVEMTRKRTRESLVQMLCEPCSYCEGKSYVLSDVTVAHKILREIRKDLPRFCGRRVAVSVSRRVAENLLGVGHEMLKELETELGRQIEVRARAELHQEQFEITALDEGPALDIEVPWLSDRVIEEPGAGKRGEGRGRGRGRKREAAEAETPAAESNETEAETPAAESNETESSGETERAMEPSGEAEPATEPGGVAEAERSASAGAPGESVAGGPVVAGGIAAVSVPPGEKTSTGIEEATAPEPASGPSPAPLASVDDPSESPILQRSLEREDS